MNEKRVVCLAADHPFSIAAKGLLLVDFDVDGELDVVADND